jgi:hypothetical protein
MEGRFFLGVEDIFIGESMKIFFKITLQSDGFDGKIFFLRVTAIAGRIFSQMYRHLHKKKTPLMEKFKKYAEDLFLLF